MIIVSIITDKYTSINSIIIYIIIFYYLLFYTPNRKILKHNKYNIVLVFFQKEIFLLLSI